MAKRSAPFFPSVLVKNVDSEIAQGRRRQTVCKNLKIDENALEQNAVKVIAKKNKIVSGTVWVCLKGVM